jgi:hypothetical protein
MAISGGGGGISLKILNGKFDSPYVIAMLLLYKPYSSNPFCNHIKRPKNGDVFCTPGKAYGSVQVELSSFLRTVRVDGE